MHLQNRTVEPPELSLTPSPSPAGRGESARLGSLHLMRRKLPLQIRLLYGLPTNTNEVVTICHTASASA